MNQKVLLLYGGFSAEKDVSINSKNDISQALQSKGYNVIEHNLNNVWNFIDTIKKEKPDIVYNGLYGNWGEDGEIQGLLDLLQIPYTHQDRRGSNCSLVHAANEPMSDTPFTWPTRLRKVRRCVAAMPRHQRGLVMRLRMFFSVGWGGAVRPFLMSLWRWPITCKSSVSTKALQRASLARWIMRAMASRSRIM